MKKYCGYYCLVHYCPNRSLMEVAGIGILLFCPEINYINVRPTKNNRRIEKIFSKQTGDGSFLQAYKEGLSRYFQSEFADGMTYQGVCSFLKERFVNDICFTDIRTVIVSDKPDSDLEDLFQKIFTDEDEFQEKKQRMRRYNPQQNLLKALRDRRKDLLNKVAIPRKLDVPEYKNNLTPSVVFLNEKVNIVIPKNVNESNITTQTGETIVAGQFVSKTEFPWGKSRIALIANIDGNSNQNTIRSHVYLLYDNDIGFYPDENSLVDYISEHAKELPDALKNYSADKQCNLVLDP